MNEPKRTKVHFFSFDDRVQIKNITSLKKFITAIFRQERHKLHSINYIFCSDKTILNINKKYLNHDFLTDVITFELSKKDEPITAEVYISVDRVRDNARTIGVSMKSELHRVLFHAVLHLCGYNDKRKKDIEVMRKKEDSLLQKYFIPRSSFT